MAVDTMPAHSFFEKHRDKMVVGRPEDCWPWTAATRHGYGMVWARGAVRAAHREAYEAVQGSGSADGLVIRHRCDNPPCVNPGHLQSGTQADNVRDKIERGRARYAPSKGVDNGCAKLTEDEVRAIRAEYVFGSRTHGTYALARRYGITRAVVGKIARRVIWRHI